MGKMEIFKYLLDTFAGTTLDEPTMEETLTRALTAKQS